MSEDVFLPDPLAPSPEIPEGMELADQNSTIEEQRKQDLEDYRRREISETKEEPLPPETETKEEPLEVVVQHDVAVSEAKAGKKQYIKLPTLVPIKTIRLDVDKFTSFLEKKFYRVRLDYDLYFEVNAKDETECAKKILKFIKSQLKGMLDTTKEDMEISEFIPNMRKAETEVEYVFD